MAGLLTHRLLPGGQQTDPPVDMTSTQKRSIVDSVLTGVEWLSENHGQLVCPGVHCHTTPTGANHTWVIIGGVATIKCQHQSCAGVVASENHRLRSAIWKVEQSEKWEAERDVRRIIGGKLTVNRPVGSSPSTAMTRPITRAGTPAQPTKTPTPGLIHQLGVSAEEVAIPTQPVASLAEWSSMYFHPAEHIGYCYDPEVRTHQTAPAAEIADRVSKVAGFRGVYSRINPMAAGGTHDYDVNAFRYCLLEIDHGLTRGKQLWVLQRLIERKAPIAWIVDSGGKSLHAALRIDATTSEEFKATAVRIYAKLGERDVHHPEILGVDPACKNAGRYTRLPNCWRPETQSRQTLIYVNPSFSVGNQ